MRERSGIELTPQPIWITGTVHALMVMTNNLSNSVIAFDLSKDPLANYRVLFHLQTFIGGQRTRLLQQAGRESDLAYVMD